MVREENAVDYGSFEPFHEGGMVGAEGGEGGGEVGCVEFDQEGCPAEG